jgi:hypothetical protein
MITDPPGRRGGVAATFERRDTRQSKNGPAGVPIRRAEEYADGDRLTPVPTSRLTGDRLTPSAAGIVSARAGGAVFPRRETGARPHPAAPAHAATARRSSLIAVRHFHGPVRGRAAPGCAAAPAPRPGKPRAARTRPLARRVRMRFATHARRTDAPVVLRRYADRRSGTRRVESPRALSGCAARGSLRIGAAPHPVADWMIGRLEIG